MHRYLFESPYVSIICLSQGAWLVRLESARSTGYRYDTDHDDTGDSVPGTVQYRVPYSPHSTVHTAYDSSQYRLCYSTLQKENGESSIDGIFKRCDV